MTSGLWIPVFRPLISNLSLSLWHPYRHPVHYLHLIRSLFRQAHYLATSSFPLHPGHTCVVHAAGGATGALLTQIAKLRGATVIATASRGPKSDAARAAGADHVISYEPNEYAFLPRLRELCPNGVDCVYDSIGAATCADSLRSLRPRGTAVFYGNATGPPAAFAPTPTLADRSLYVHRPMLHHFLATPEEREGRARDLFEWIADGKLRVRIARTFPLSEAAAAHRLLESRGALGKLLLVPPEV